MGHLRCELSELDGTVWKHTAKMWPLLEGIRLTEFVFKCIKGYTVTELFKDLFLPRNSGRRGNENNDVLPRLETVSNV